MKCPQCNIIYKHIGWQWYAHCIDPKFCMPMDGYLPEHWERITCSLAGHILKLPR